jgi:hypothetical protein
MLCLLFLSGCGVDNPYKAFDPQGAIVKKYINMSEEELVKADNALKTTSDSSDPIRVFSRKVNWNNREISFQCNVDDGQVKSIHYIYYPVRNNTKENCSWFIMKAYDDMTKALGPHENGELMLSHGDVNDIFENDTLPPFNQAVLNQIIDYISTYPSVSAILRFTWKSKNGITPSLILGLDLQDTFPASCHINFNKPD